MNPTRYYIPQSSMFDSRPYEADAMKAYLSVHGMISHPRLARPASNQPAVLTFRLTRKATTAAVSELLGTLPGHDGRQPLCIIKDW